MKASEFRQLIREEIKKTLKEFEVTGDFNTSSLSKSKFIRTPEGKQAVQVIKMLVSKPFDASKLDKTLKKLKLKMNDFMAVAEKAGLEIEGQGNVDNDGNGDFAVYNDNYTDQGVAITYFNDKFYSVG